MSDSESAQSEASATSGSPSSPSLGAHTAASVASGPPQTVYAHTEASAISEPSSPPAVLATGHSPLGSPEVFAAEEPNGYVNRETTPVDSEQAFVRAVTRVEDKPTRSSAAQFSFVDGQRDALMLEVKNRAQIVPIDFLLAILPPITTGEVRKIGRASCRERVCLYV